MSSLPHEGRPPPSVRGAPPPIPFSTRPTPASIPILAPAPAHGSSHPPTLPNPNTEVIAPRPAPALPPTTTLIAPLKVCPEQDFVEWKASWYGIPNIPNFDICSKCYADSISSSIFRDAFSIIPKPQSGFYTNCDFNTPRSKILWAQALRSRDLSALREFMLRRSRIPPCKGVSGIKGTLPDHNWYSPREGIDPIDGLIVCAACYEDTVLATPLAQYFEPTRNAQNDADTWSCELAMEFIQDAIQKHTVWHTFASAARMRMQAPPCPGIAGTTISRRWWRPKVHIPDMVVCDACVYDHVFTSKRNSNDFEPSRDVQQHGVNWACDLAVPGILFALTQRIRTDVDRNLWRDAALYLMATPCTKAGITSNEWYTLYPGVENHDICAGCFRAWVKPLGLERYFTRHNYPPGTNRLCDFEVSTPRSLVYRQKIIEAYATGDITVFGAYAMSHARFPPCPLGTAVVNYKWYGTDKFGACEECYEECVRTSPFDNKLTTRGQLESVLCICDLGSPRMRTLWKSACESGDFEGFCEIAQHRNKVYCETVPALNEFRELRAAQSRLTTSLAVNAALFGGMPILTPMVLPMEVYRANELERAWKAVE